MSTPSSSSGQALPHATTGPSLIVPVTSSVSATSGRSTHASSRLYDVPQLENDGNNYYSWKLRVAMILEVRGLKGLIDGTDPRPGSDDITQLLSWLERDREARAQILLTLKDEPLSGIVFETTATEIWKKLQDRYEGKGLHSVARLIGELFQKSLSDEKPLEPQLNLMRQKAHSLASLGHPLNDSLVAIAITLALPMSYSTIRTILLSNPTLNTETVIAQVLIEERTRAPAQTALTVTI